MQQVPLCEISVIIAAQPGNGPNGYIRVICAPARYTGHGMPGTLLAWTSFALVMLPEIQASTGAGNRLNTGANNPVASIAGSSRVFRTNSRIWRIRLLGSGSPTGAAKRAPAKRLPPRESALPRRLMGMPMGMVSTRTPKCSW